MKAVLLAAGLGTRLAPLTEGLPKILAPLGAETLLARQLSYLVREGVREVAVNVHHQAGAVREFLDGHETPVDVRLSPEPELLGTAGALDPLRDFVSGPTVVLYGDVLLDASLAELLGAHFRTAAAATLACYASSSLEGKGVLELDGDGRVCSFVEKGETPRAAGYVNAGLYAISPRVLDYVRPGLDFGHDVWPQMLAAGERLFGHLLTGYVQDVGSPGALERASADLTSGTLRW